MGGIHETDFASKEWFEKEFLPELGYTLLGSAQDTFTGVLKGGVNILENLGLSHETADSMRSGLQPAKQETTTYGLTKDIIGGISSTLSKAYSKDDIFAKYMQNDPYASKAHEIMAGTFESIGRMIPSIVTTAITKDGKYAVAGAVASSAYFYASTFGQSFDEAINKGLSLEDSRLYALQIAGIETLTEQIGGFTFGGGIGGNIISNIVNESFEEVIAELATSGTTYDEEGNPVYETPKQIFERVLTAGIMGGLSGGIMGGAKILGNTLIKGTAYQQVSNIDRISRLNIDKYGYESTQRLVNYALEDVTKGLNKTIGNPKNLEKTKKLLSESTAGEFVEFNEEENKFVLTKFGEQMKQDIRARQGNTIIDDNYVASLSPSIKVRETVPETNEKNKNINKKIAMLI